MALVVDDAAAVAVAVEAERDIRAALPHRLRHRVQHMQVFGIGVIAREGEVEVAVERRDLDAERAEEFWRESAGRSVAAGGDRLDPSVEFRPVGQVGDVVGGKVGHEFIKSAGLGTRSRR